MARSDCNPLPPVALSTYGRVVGRIWLRGVLTAGVAIAVLIGPVAFAEPGGRRNHLPIKMTTIGPTTVIVDPGDHLWKLSEQRLLGTLGREPEDSEVSPYWRTVIDTNRDNLRSGDPDLIYPGEEVDLPDPG